MSVAKTEVQLALNIQRMAATPADPSMSAILRRSLFMLHAAADALDKNGNPAAPIVMWRADYQRVRKHFGGKPRVTVKYGEHPVLNGGPSSSAARARLCGTCGQRPGQPETCGPCTVQAAKAIDDSQVKL